MFRWNVLKAPFYLNLFSEDLLIQRTGKVDDLLVHWSKPLAWGKWTSFLSHPACACHVHQNELHAMPFGPRYQGHSRFSKNYPPCPSLTAISCLYTIIMMFLKGMFINISSVECLQEVLEGKSYMYPPTVILLPLCSVSLTRKNSQRCRIIDSLRPLGCNDQSI